MKIAEGRSGLVNLICCPIVVLGPGKRVGMWFQGCSRHCAGCFSPHTWNFDESFMMSLDDVASRLNGYAVFSDKLTISGGEPFEQEVFLKGVLEKARKIGYRDILVYTGKEYATIKRRCKNILSMIDVLIDGPFVQECPTTSIWKGSSNQRMHILTTDAELRKSYEQFARCEDVTGSMQVIRSERGSYIIGIPRHHDLTKTIEKAIKEQ